MSRFRAPARLAVPPQRFGHPGYADLGSACDFLHGPWPAIEQLNAGLSRRRHLYAAVEPRFVTQSPALLADGLHYEARIHADGRIATRADNWHDLFNALMWMTRFELKCAVNAAYVREAACTASRVRTRAQCSLTHFDEAGAIVMLRDPALLAAWDAHAWPDFFGAVRAHPRVVDVLLFGHALFEHLLVPRAMPVAKCLVVLGGTDGHAASRALADDIVAGRVLCDPQELRPLPLAGLPGWHEDGDQPDFLVTAPCFRPCRPGRVYPPPRDGAGSCATAGVRGGD